MRARSMLAGALLGLLLLVGSAEAAPGRPHPDWPPRTFAVYYGGWDDAAIAQAWGFDLVVAHPGRDLTNLSAAIVDRIRRGRDGRPGTADDTIVLGYVTIGEDDEPPATPVQEGGPGPKYRDPARGMVASGQGFPARFLDETSFVFDPPGRIRFAPDGKPRRVPGRDGLPDENGVWGSYYVDPSDPEWRAERIVRMERIAAMGVDGFFLDTLDTGSPWGRYPYLAEPMGLLVKALRERFPGHYLLANRGLFLFESQPDLIRPNIDGVLFESYATEWDWEADSAVQNPWVGSNRWITREHLVPQSRRPDGVTLFFLDYVNLEQDDLYPLLHDRKELLEGTGGVAHLSHPELQRFYPAEEEIFPSSTGRKPPEIRDFTLPARERGRFTLRLDTSALGGLALGRDLFLDVRVAKTDATVTDLPLVRRLPIESHAVRVTPGSQGAVLEADGLGLGKGDQAVFARLVGPARDLATPWARLLLPPEPGAFPGLVEGVEVVGLERSLQVEWEDGAADASAYEVLLGVSPASLVPVGRVTERHCLLEGLENGTRYFVSVAGLDAQGKPGCPSVPIGRAPRDCTPPPPPAGTATAVAGRTLRITWRPVDAPDIEAYRVYCHRSDRKWGIPHRRSSQDAELVLDDVPPGEYAVFVTSMDASGNESPPGRSDRVTVR